MVNMPSGYSQEPFDDIEGLDEEFVINALLKHNYFPNQKSDSDELPPVFSSASLTIPVAEMLESTKEKGRTNYPGYDSVVYKLTRFNGVSRVCSIPHPKAYAALVLAIGKNWQRLSYISENENSMIIPRHHKDGRLVIMDYDDSVSEARRALTTSFGKRFVVKTDISNCYPSIYSHSVPWAVAGFVEAKENRTKKSKWYNKLDKALQGVSRNETNGIPIGPGTSNVISESILARVDSELRDHFTYYRYMDDYTAYCSSHEEAELFVFTLAKRLANYKLTLNVGKTKIQALPTASTSDWVIELQNCLPTQISMSAATALRFMDKVVQVAKDYPDGSVTKYGFKTLTKILLNSENEECADAIRAVLLYAVSITFHYPILMPLLDSLFDKHKSAEGEFAFQNELQAIICENVRLSRSDAISWGLFLAKKYGVTIRQCCYDQIMESQDCIPILLIYLTAEQEQRERVVSYAKKLDLNDLYCLDQQWLLLYQLFKDDIISDPYGISPPSDTSFSIMKSNGVDFVSDIPNA